LFDGKVFIIGATKSSLID